MNTTNTDTIWKQTVKAYFFFQKYLIYIKFKINIYNMLKLLNQHIHFIHLY